MKKIFTVLMAVFAIAVFSVPAGAQQAMQRNIDQTLGQYIGQWPMRSGESFTRNLSAYGENVTVAINTAELITNQGATPTWPTAAAVVSCVSSKAADDAAGTGVRTLQISGVNSQCEYATETINMDGTVASATTGTFLRIDKIVALTVGSNLGAVGKIDCSIGGNVQLQIATRNASVGIWGTANESAYALIADSGSSAYTYSGTALSYECSSDGDIRCYACFQNLSTNVWYCADKADDGGVNHIVKRIWDIPPTIGECYAVGLFGYSEDATSAAIFGRFDMFRKNSTDNR